MIRALNTCWLGFTLAIFLRSMIENKIHFVDKKIFLKIHNEFSLGSWIHFNLIGRNLITKLIG
jgi:hypothetical protein